jgi:hypothetical protein
MCNLNIAELQSVLFCFLTVLAAAGAAKRRDASRLAVSEGPSLGTETVDARAVTQEDESLSPQGCEFLT